MSLTIINNPASSPTVASPNIYPGFSPVEFMFKRKDDSTAYVDPYELWAAMVLGYVEVTSALNYSSLVSAGDYVYFYQRIKVTKEIEGNTVTVETYEFSGYFEVKFVSSILFQLNDPDHLLHFRVYSSEYTITTEESFINYKKDHYVEIELLRNTLGSYFNPGPIFYPDKIYPGSLKDYGDNEGNYKIDISVFNDNNELNFDDETKVLTDMFKYIGFRFREVWDVSSSDWTLISGLVILVYGFDDLKVNDISNSYENSVMVEGYKKGFAFITSPEIAQGDSVTFYCDEYDISDSLIKTTELKKFYTDYEFGVLFVSMTDFIFNPSSVKINIREIWA